MKNYLKQDKKLNQYHFLKREAEVFNKNYISFLEKTEKITRIFVSVYIQVKKTAS